MEGLITDENLRDSTWIKCLREVAVKNAEAQESAAQWASLHRWHKWIREGPAAGLRRHHQFSRGADGWIPIERSSGEAVQVDEMSWMELKG